MLKKTYWFAISLLLGILHAQDLLPSTVQETLGVPAAAIPKVIWTLKGNLPDARLTTGFKELSAVAIDARHLLLRIEFAQKPNPRDTLIIYLDGDKNFSTGRTDKIHLGTDIMLVLKNKEVVPTQPWNAWSQARMVGSLLDNMLYLDIEGPFALEDNNLKARIHLLAEHMTPKEKLGQSTPPQELSLPLNAAFKQGRAAFAHSAGLTPLSYYGYYNDKIALLPLANKGLERRQVEDGTVFKSGRPCPQVSLPATSQQNKTAAVACRKVKINLLEEQGTPRANASIRLGFPLPRGQVWNLRNLRLLDSGSTEQPLSSNIMCTWPDGSLKWVLLQFNTPLKAHENTDWFVEYGADISARAYPQTLALHDTGRLLAVATGKLNAVIDKEHFSIATLSLPGDTAPKGKFEILLKDENGRLFTTSSLKPRSIRIEEQSARRIVVRVEGDYGSAEGEKLMSYVIRLSFMADSPVMGIAWTHVDTELDHEFTDITSLELRYLPREDVTSCRIARETAQKQFTYSEAAVSAETPRLSVFQLDDQRLAAAKAFHQQDADLSTGKGRLNGTFQTQVGSSAVVFSVNKFWQRWPKEINVSKDALSVGILPQQPSEKYGQDLSYWLVYPFVEGKYRMKWGMSFTEHLAIDISGTASHGELSAETDWPVIGVLSASWYDETKVFGDVSVPDGRTFTLWDEWFEKCAQNEFRRREKQHEYGVMNYGDSFGERGRNWTNNEYDPAHGLYMQFVRTGNRTYAHMGQERARHQADVDIVHAYPDPFYIGTNHQHSIGHTGQWSQNPVRATWTHKYDVHTHAENGHTWTEGMADAWCLSADPRILEAVYELGEHITWGMSYRIKSLGTHERSAGWSLKAIMCLYRYLGDPLYLEAAKRIVEIPLREQKFDRGGAWPHKLPSDHWGKEPGAEGNALFLMGVLLSGLKDYYEATADARVAKSIVACANWIMLSYDAELHGWPYTARVDGMPLWNIGPGGSTMLPQCIAFAGKLTGEKRFIDAAYDTIATMIASRTTGAGKDFGTSILMQLNALGIIQDWYRQHLPQEANNLLTGTLSELRMHMAKPTRSLNLRAPADKLMFAHLQRPAAELAITRIRTGAMPKREATGTVKVQDAAGKSIFEQTFSTDDEATFKVNLAGVVGAVYRIAIHDDERGSWNAMGDGIQVVAQLGDRSSLASIGTCIYAIRPPQGTKEFQLKLTGIHRGGYGCILYDDEGKVVFQFEGEHLGDAQISTLGGVTNSQWHQVSLPSPANGNPYKMVLSAAQDFGLELKGIPPYLARTPDECFTP